MDLKYLQNVRFAGSRVAQLDVDVFNVFNSQTGYNYETRAHAAGFKSPLSFFDPRRVQVALRLVF